MSELIKKQLSLITLSPVETLQQIKQNRLSIARFGDGEINIVVHAGKGNIFQYGSLDLTNKMRTVLKARLDNLLVCIPNLTVGGEWWANYWQNIFDEYCQYLIYDRLYGDSWVSRSPFFWQYKQDAIRLWQDIWHNRDVVFIMGEGSRFNYHHELFDNVATKKTIVSLPTNAYSDMDRIISICQQEKTDVLFIISLGATATILAYELTKLGYQALDVGHITNCYDKVFYDGKQPEELPIKGNHW